MSRAIAIVLALTLASCALMPSEPRRSILVNGNAISYVDNAGSAPTVVFEAGLGDGLRVWNEVYEQVATSAGVFAYSRPGYETGKRQPDRDGQRTAKESARLLRDTLEHSKTPAPYVLVGHSIGGLYTLEFARSYPHLVAGLVLVDARLPGFTEQCIASGVRPCSPPNCAILLAPPQVADELRGIRQSEAEAPSPADIGSIPTTLIVATKPPKGGPAAAQPIWLEVQRQFADAMSDGRMVIAQGAGHYIQRDAPEMVVDEIERMLSRVR
ncbi:MAG: alpha/beta hydrolase [Thiohalocapsa sp.]